MSVELEVGAKVKIEDDGITVDDSWLDDEGDGLGEDDDDTTSADGKGDTVSPSPAAEEKDVIVGGTSVPDDVGLDDTASVLETYVGEYVKSVVVGGIDEDVIGLEKVDDSVVDLVGLEDMDSVDAMIAEGRDENDDIVGFDEGTGSFTKYVGAGDEAGTEGEDDAVIGLDEGGAATTVTTTCSSLETNVGTYVESVGDAVVIAVDGWIVATNDDTDDGTGDAVAVVSTST